MAVNKVVFGAVSIMDISDSTVTAETLAKGATAYDKSGEKITGTMEAKADPVLQTKTVTPTTAQQNVTPDSGYDGLSKVTVNAMPTATQATPSIEVSSAGLITAKSTQSAGYVAAGTKSATKQLTVQAAQTITPGTSNKTITSGRYLTGTQTIKGDSNLVAENIKSGTSIFGVSGTVVEQEDLDEVITTQDSLISQIQTALQGKAAWSGSSVETCTVEINLGSSYITQISASVLNNGNVELIDERMSDSSIISYTLNNVVCDTLILIRYYLISIPQDNGALGAAIAGAGGLRLYKAPSESGAFASLIIYENA